RVARVGAMHAGSQPAPPAERPQPCQGKPPTSPEKAIKHASFLGALLGAVAGALLAAAAFAAAAAAVAALVALTGFTGGLGLALVVGAVKLAAGFGLTYLLNDQIAAISGGVAAMVDSVTPSFGEVKTGSENVFVERLPASRAEVDTVKCKKHNSLQPIAQGSDTVYVNQHAAARIDDKTVCGATLKEGASTVYFGAGQQTLLAIQDEFSWWEKGLLIAVAFLVPPSRGLFKGLRLLLTHPRAALRGMYAGALMTARELKHIAGCASRAFRESKGLARVKESIIAFLKDPVYIASGDVIESRQDIALGQTLPLVFER
ncbi:PAAR domain-containing protein, partial [Lonsdalea quercina]